MVNINKSWQAKHKLGLQILALCLLVLTPIGVYSTVMLGANWATWGLMGLIVGGMILVFWLS